jgi:hypothetical protein
MNEFRISVSRVGTRCAPRAALGGLETTALWLAARGNI